VEALPMTQWFIDVNKKIPGKEKSLKQLMHDAVATGHNNDPKQKIKITPARYEKIYFNWIENLRDWCISRQIWWGHQIPVWYKDKEIYCGTSAPEGKDWVQDSDTLDTWFSSGLWTFSTLNWPAKNWEQTFHPSSWMQMGYEILFFWMARMILMTTYTIDQIPFKDVYIHGMLRNEKGGKFSKSSGNNLDPIEIIDKYGCDALRLSLIMGVSPGNDSRFYEEKVENCRNFVNKLWNIGRYIISNQQEKVAKKINYENLTLADNWILSKLKSVTEEITENITNFQFSQSAEKLRDFTWNDFADWYVEISKFEDNKKEKQWILNHVLETLLKLWHPFIPFVTEFIWKEFSKKNLLMIEHWPKTELIDLQGGSGDANELRFDLIQEIITSVRNGRLENNIVPGKKIKVIIDVKNQEEYLGEKTEKLISYQENIIKNLRTGITELRIISSGEKIGNAIQRTIAGINIYIPLEGLIDTEKEKAKAEKEIANIEKFVVGLKSRLKDKAFVSKAPKQVINQQKETLAKKEAELAELKKHLASLK
jgi:valyl-tRNA synthetase